MLSVLTSKRNARARIVAAVALFAMAFIVAGVGLPGSTLRASADTSGSALTVSGTDAFSNVKVTVNQTQSLVNQIVTVSWSGATPTQPDIGGLSTDYMQIMQCWGDNPAGPTREQCQFGALAGDARGGTWAATRQVSYGDTLIDPLETYLPPSQYENAYVPFQSATGKTTTGLYNEFYDANTTNEIPFGRTRSDGTGIEYFEVQTAQEAPGLGCGQIIDDGSGKSHTRNCWLVVVPRDNHEVDSSVRSTSSTDQLLSSPLSASNWAHRIVVPLSFLPIGASCPIGAKETQLVGQELVTDAIHQWQPSLCADSSYTYTFSQVADNTARRQLTAADPQLIFTSQPLPADQVDPTSPPVYAPVTLGALVFTYLVERQPTYNAPDSVQALAGTRVSTLKLSPRLVAKLLTESYRNSVNTPQSVPNYIAKNPQDIFADPEFIALNPEFKNYRIPYGAPDALVPIGITDAAAQLWKWMLSDKEARAFVDGTPDKWGMKVNEHYKGLAINTDSFPKADPYCATFGAAQQPLCTLDAHPYAADMHAAARAVSRGDTLSRSTWDPTATPPAWKPTDVEPQGRRAVIGFTTLSIADRYSLPTAQILNSGGSYVQADDASMLASYKSMTKDAATGMLLANPTSSDPAAYPLTTLTYAATRPAGLSADEAKAYASLLRYAAGAGQTPGIDVGQLPQGYLPLPASMRTQTNAVAATIETNAGKKTPVSTPSPTPAPTSTSGGVPSTTPTSVPTTQPTSTSPSTSQPAPVPSSSQPTITIVAARTPASPVGFARYGLVIVLVLGGLAACVGPALLGFGALRR